MSGHEYWYLLVRLSAIPARRGGLRCVGAIRREETIAIAGRAIRAGASWLREADVSAAVRVVGDAGPRGGYEKPFLYEVCGTHE